MGSKTHYLRNLNRLTRGGPLEGKIPVAGAGTGFPLWFGAHDDPAGIEQIARHRLLHGNAHVFHDPDDVQIGGEADADKKRGHHVLDATPEAAVLRAGVIDRNDLAAGLDYPVNFPAHLMGILDRGDHVRGHDEIEIIVGKVQVGGVHDLKVEAAAAVDIGGFFPGPFDHRPGNVDSHQPGPRGVKIQGGAGTYADLQDLLVRLPGYVFKSLAAARTQEFAENVFVEWRIKVNDPAICVVYDTKDILMLCSYIPQNWN